MSDESTPVTEVPADELAVAESEPIATDPEVHGIDYSRGGIDHPREAEHIASNRALNQLPEGQEPAPPVAPTPSGRQIARDIAASKPGYGKE